MHLMPQFIFRPSIMIRFLLLLLFCATRCLASDISITWKGEVRVRGEVDGRDFNRKTAPNIYTLLRARFGAEIKPQENIHVIIQMQDSRIFGSEGTGAGATTTNTGNLDLHQGIIQIDNFLTTGLSAQLGRMEFSYGHERLIGAVGWNNVGRAFDGGVLRYTWGNNSLDAFVSNVNENQVAPSVATPGAVVAVPEEGLLFSGLYFKSALLPSLHVDAYTLHEWNQKQTVPGYIDLSRVTLGSRVTGEDGSFSCEGEFAYQLGKRQQTDISAFLLTGALTYAFGDFPLASITAGYDYLSGDGPGASSTYRSFDPTFHTGHKFYGFMDYFIAIPQNTDNRGLQDAILKVLFKFDDSWTLSVWGHHFMLARSLTGRRSLGQEIDVVGGVNYTSNLSFEFGVSGFIPAELMRAKYGSGDAALWAYGVTRVWF